MKTEFPLYVAIDPTQGDEPADCLLTFPTFAAMTGAAQIRAEEGRPYGARNPTLYSGAQAKVQAAEDVAARFASRAWVPLSTLRPGAVFEAKTGWQGVKTLEESLGMCICIDLGNGMRVMADDADLVREVPV